MKARALTADVVVIGGGIAGLGAAACLSEAARVVLLEAEARPATHSTARSAAMFILSYSGRAAQAATAASEAFFVDAPLPLDAPLLSARGLVMVAGHGDEAALEAARVADGLERLTPEEAAEHVPTLRVEAVAAAAMDAGARDIDVEALVQAWTRQLKSRGGQVVSDAPAQALRRERGAWVVETPATVALAPVVVNAAGAWADVVAERAGVARIGLQPMRRSAAVLPPPDDRDIRFWPMWLDVRESFYARPIGGRLMVSPAEEDPVEPHDAYADDMRLAEGLDRYERMSTVPVTRVERSWAGLRTFASDRAPVVGFDPEAEGFFWLAGQGGFGVQTAPALSRLAAALVAGLPLDPAEAALAGMVDPARLRRRPA